MKPDDFQLDNSPFSLDGGDFTLEEPVLPADPLAGVAWTGDAEPDSLAEAEAIRTAFMRRAKDQDARQRATTDSEYWCCLCFQTREQKEAFLKAMDWLRLGDKYLDGRQVAQRQGISLPQGPGPAFTKAKADKTLSELSLPLE